MTNIFLRLAVIGMICSWALPDSQLGVRKRETARRYCGPYLPNILRLICNGTYHTYDWKRNGGSTQVKQAQGTAVNSDRIFFFLSQLEVCYFFTWLVAITNKMQLSNGILLFHSTLIVQHVSSVRSLIIRNLIYIHHFREFYWNTLHFLHRELEALLILSMPFNQNYTEWLSL